jgi:site-specific DNA recombinase
MRVAIYARRSTEEHQAASLDVQLEEARRFIAARGWTVDDAHIYTDSAVSRAEFKKRPALIRMLNDAAAGAFGAVVTRDESRLGGDMHRTGLLIQDLHEHGVQLWYYFAGERVVADDPTSRLVIAIRAFASELEREKLAGRTREHLKGKAERGLNVGGRVYGYDNVPVMEGERRTRVEYAINEAEAAVVRDIFARYARGDGIRTIAKALNAAAVPPPRAGARGTGSWAPSCVWAILRRDRYRGSLVWGRVGAKYKGGTRVTEDRPEGEWTRVERPELAIIDADTWERVLARQSQRTMITSTGRAGRPPRYLLSGIARCAGCGGPIGACNTRNGTRMIKAYRCMWAKDRGATVCDNNVCRPIAEVNGCLVDWIRANVLSPAVVDAVLAAARRQIQTAGLADDTGTEPLENELARLTVEINRIATAIATTDSAPDVLARGLVDREARAKELRARIAVMREAISPSSLVWSEVESEARERVCSLTEAFNRGEGEARTALEALLRGPIQCATVMVSGKPRFRLTGEIAIGRLLDADLSIQGRPQRVQNSTTGSIPFAVTERSRVAA